MEEDGAAYYFWFDVLHGCGCGNSDVLGADAAGLFTAIAKGCAHREIFSDHYHELMAHWFDSLELIEHGANIGSAVLSKRGKEVWAEMERLSHAH
jgi:hypothetical protein